MLLPADTPVYVVLLPGFVARQVTGLIGDLRERGRRVTGLSLTPHFVESAEGLAVRADHVLGPAPRLVRQALLILPDGADPALLLVEARLHRLVSAVLTGGGGVVTTPQSGHALERLGFPAPDQTDQWHIVHSEDILGLVERLTSGYSVHDVALFDPPTL